MKNLFLVLTISLTSLSTYATELRYKIDLSHSKMDEITAFDMCGLPKEIAVNSNADLPTVVIQKTQTINPGQLKINFIQASSGSVNGGSLEEPFMGDYRDRVAIVHSKEISGAYKGGIYQRIEVLTYGSPAAPKAFTVDVELLNYRESAELAEGSVCTGFAYRLQ